MSWDIDLVIDTGGKELGIVSTIGNMTSNVNKMYCKAFDNEDGLDTLNDMQCSEAIKRVSIAIIHMIKYKDELMLMNPKNGWGNYDGALLYLCDLFEGCIKNPLCKIRIL